MDSDELLCSRNARSQKALVEGSFWVWRLIRSKQQICCPRSDNL